MYPNWLPPKIATVFSFDPLIILRGDFKKNTAQETEISVQHSPHETIQYKYKKKIIQKTVRN